jgi:hypothetical protein
VLTKSPLLLRDLDLMQEIARSPSRANLSIPTLDEKAVARERAAHAAPEGAHGGGRGAQPRRHPDGRSSSRR